MIKKFNLTNSSAAFDSSDQQPTNTAPIQDAATTEQAPANGGAPDTPDTGDVAVFTTPVKPVSPPEAAAVEDFVSTSLTETVPRMKAYLVPPSGVMEDLNGKYYKPDPLLARKFDSTKYQDEAEGLCARRIIDQVAWELHELGKKLPVYFESRSVEMASELLNALNSGIKIELPTYVPLKSVAQEIGVSPDDLKNALHNRIWGMHDNARQVKNNYRYFNDEIVVESTLASSLTDEIAKKRKWEQDEEFKLYKALEKLDSTCPPLDREAPPYEDFEN